jgi:hypothetical protein
VLTSAERKRLGLCLHLCLLEDYQSKFFWLNAENTASTGGADQFSSVLILVVAHKRIYEGDWIKRYDLR